MNKARRNELERIINALEDLRDKLFNVASDEREAFDNMPESLQQSERGEQIEMNADDLCCAYDDLDNTINALTDILDNNG